MMTLSQIIAEPLDIHQIGTSRDRLEQALVWLERVGARSLLRQSLSA